MINEYALYCCLFRKLAKFIFENDAEPSKQQPACLLANIHKKTSTRYSPFQLVFGREFYHLTLLRRLNLDADLQYDSDGEVGNIIETPEQIEDDLTMDT